MTSFEGRLPARTRIAATLPAVTSSIGYRADIDGLRAIAVTVVVLFHAQLEAFKGGFVGVDVFFVISGYLITSIIVREMEEGRFSLWHFYERRVRRIFPALFAMLGGASLLAFLLLLPTELTIFGKTLAATALFSANFYFWRNTGYFAEEAESNALLHTWSLAVEEQFYLFFPLLMIVLMRRGRRATAIIIGALLVGSLTLSQWQVGVRPAWSFYLLPMRAWELMLGALLAMKLLPPPGKAAAALAASGLGLILWPVLGYSPDIAFPGLSALPPCLGAALLIHAGTCERAPLGTRLLKLPPMVFVGQISYALYLWHWPLLVLPRLYLGRALTLPEALAAITVATGLAALSWKFIETPIRRARFTGQGKPLVAGGLMASLAFLIFGGWLAISGGAPDRFAPAVVAADRAQILPAIPPSCFGPASDNKGCPTRDYDILLWGDSHAGHYLPAIEELARAHGLKVQLQSAGGCPPLPGLVPVAVPSRTAAAEGHHIQFERECPAINAQVLNELERNPHVKAVALAAAWTFWGEGTDLGTGERRYLMKNQDDGARSTTATRQLMRNALDETIRRLEARGIRVMLLGQVPDNPQSPPLCMARSYRRHEPVTGCARSAHDALQRLAWSRSWLAGAARSHGAYLFDPARLICLSSRCAIADNGTPLYRDGDHLTTFGARLLGRRINPAFFDFSPARGGGDQTVGRPSPSAPPWQSGQRTSSPQSSDVMASAPTGTPHAPHMR